MESGNLRQNFKQAGSNFNDLCRKINETSRENSTVGMRVLLGAAGKHSQC